MCGWRTYLFQEAIASLLIPSLLPSAKYAGKCAEVNKDSSKSLHMSHFCVPGWICCEGDARWSYVFGLSNEGPLHKFYIAGDTNFSITDMQVLFSLIKKRASYSLWMVISLPPCDGLNSETNLKSRQLFRGWNQGKWKGNNGLVLQNVSVFTRKKQPTRRPSEVHHCCRTTDYFKVQNDGFIIAIWKKWKQTLFTQEINK